MFYRIIYDLNHSNLSSIVTTKAKVGISGKAHSCVRVTLPDPIQSGVKNEVKMEIANCVTCQKFVIVSNLD